MAGRYLDTDSFKIDKEFQELLPYLKEDEYKQLEENILTYGLLDPIKIWISPKGENIIIDGHHRYRIIKENNLELSPWTDYKILHELKTREDVKEWMMEQQLGRRNLSDAEKYEIVQRFKTLIQNKAKKNQSAGGKGLANLPKVNTRKELAEKVGVCERTYSKLDKVMQSDNEEVKQKLRNKEISTDKAFKIINDVSSKSETEIRTPKVQIEEIDTRISDIEKEEQRLQQEKENILKRRKFVFESLDIQCPVKYRWADDRDIYAGVNITFYEEFEGKENVLYEGYILDEKPHDVYTRKFSAKLKADFLMMWGKAYKEHINAELKHNEDWKKAWEDINKKLNNGSSNLFDTANKPMMNELINAGYKALAKKYHPD
ncbi:MAG: hypothetical protein EOM50_20610, partial [Erysipelotrichia bacterium]|nr:hypothetical protein [Erysipelotrichia bacterium]